MPNGEEGTLVPIGPGGAPLPAPPGIPSTSPGGGVRVRGGLQTGFLQLNNAKAAQRLFDTLGVNPGGLRLSVRTDVQPVAVVESPSLSEIEKFAWAASSNGPVAAQFSHVQIFNPAGSGVILHVSNAVISLGAAANVGLNTFDTPLTAAGGNIGFRDRRLPGLPGGQIRTEANAAALGTITPKIIGVPVANDARRVVIDAFLDAGQGLLFQVQTVNIEIQASYEWEEFPRS